ncbi:MAG: ribosome maturation factor RimM [Syntrophomonadaceae bacterium]|jgi:16S rRNA processing protein RimM
MDSGELIAIGRILGTYGLNGRVKVFPLTDFPERFFDLSRVIIDKGIQQCEMVVEKVQPYQNRYLFKLRGIDSLEAAKPYKNALIKIPRSETYQLPEGYYYYFELEGLAVYDEEIGFLGYLQEVLETGANEVYVINSEQFGEVLIPAIKDVILNVDLEKKMMKIRLLPGLIE